MRRMPTWLLSVCVATCVIGCAAPTSQPTVTPPAAAPASAQTALLVPFEKVVLDNGATLMLARKADVPLVALSARLRGGALDDSPEQFGLASITADLLEKGAAGRDARVFSEAVADVGGSISSFGGLESSFISAGFLAEDTDLMIDLVLDMLMTPQLPKLEFEKLQTRSIESLKAARDGDPRGLVGLYGAAYLFGDHAYGRAVGGLEGTLATLTHQDVIDHHRDHYGADRLILSVVGDIDIGRVRARLEARLKPWPRAKSPLPSVAAKAPVAGGKVLLIDKPDATQSYFWMGNVGVSERFAQRAELNVANTIFGGRFTSMLNTALRVESGLTYGANSRLSQGTQPGSVRISSFTATATTIEAMDLARATLTRLHTETPSDALVLSAKNYLRGQTPLSYETAEQMAASLSSLAFYDRERAYVDGYDAAVAAVDAKGLAEVIRTVYPTSDELVTVVIGKADAIRDDLARYGVVEEMSVKEPAFAP
ncbi:MAG: M16 family metallopeptidase [Gammaproteobacteria bacterium]